MFLVGFCLRTVMVWHMTWLINSATHIWGYRNYTTSDQSRNLWWVALVTFGKAGITTIMHNPQQRIMDIAGGKLTPQVGWFRFAKY